MNRTIDHHVEGRLGLGDPSHAVRQTGRAESRLTQTMAVASAPENLFILHSQVFDDDLAVAGRAVHRLHLTNVVPALRRDVHDERRRRSRGAFWHVEFGPGNQDRELRTTGIGDEPFVAVDDPFVSVFFGVRSNQRRIGSGDLGLGHGEARHHRSIAERAQVTLLLIVVAPVQKRVHIALVGRHAVENPRTDASLPGFGVHHRQLHVTQPHPAPLLGHVRKPQSESFGLLAQSNDGGEIVATRKRVFFILRPRHRRNNGPLDELANPQADLFVFGRESEVNGHGRPLLSPRRRCR